jgi:hypothetical protein
VIRGLLLGVAVAAAPACGGNGALYDCGSDVVSQFVNAANPLCHAPAAGQDAARVCVAVEGEPPCDACVRARCCAAVLDLASCDESCSTERAAADACEADHCAGACPQ